MTSVQNLKHSRKIDENTEITQSIPFPTIAVAARKIIYFPMFCNNKWQLFHDVPLQSEDHSELGTLPATACIVFKCKITNQVT